MKSKSNLERLSRLRKFALIVAPIFLLACDQIHPAGAILNCFTPNMFKMGKGGQPIVYGPHSGERANWYPQSQHQYLSYPSAMGYGQNPMKMLFQPKWRGSLFGPKKWMDWRMGSNLNFYRPGYGYMSAPVAPITPPLSPSNSYQFNDQLNLPPFSGSQTLLQSITNPYASSQQLNDGWSAPLGPFNQGTRPSSQQQQTQLNSYDSYTVSPGSNVQPAKQQQFNPNMDSYGTKGGSGNNKQQFSTTKNILVADAGYSMYDAHLMGHLRNNSTPYGGYSYPEWYSGVVDSPAKIGQQLYKLQKSRTNKWNI